MFNQYILAVLAGLMLSSTPAAAMEISPTPAAGAMVFDRAQPIEQPVGLKVGVTIGGLALIGLELWWFLGGRQTRLPDRA